MQKKKATRAYKIGYTDGLVSGKNNNTFTSGSTRYNDYEEGYRVGIQTAVLEGEES